MKRQISLSDGVRIELTVTNGSVCMELSEPDAQGNMWPAHSVTMNQTDVDSLIAALQEVSE
jgi:hypothetical protein